MLTFLNPLDVLVPKIPIFIFYRLWDPSIELYWGGSSQTAASTPPPPQLKARPPMRFDTGYVAVGASRSRFAEVALGFGLFLPVGTGLPRICLVRGIGARRASLNRRPVGWLVGVHAFLCAGRVSWCRGQAACLLTRHAVRLPACWGVYASP